MRAFIVLCLVAAACSDKLGYDYQPVEHSDSGLAFTPGSSLIGAGSEDSPTFDSQAPLDVERSNDSHSVDGPQGDLDKQFYTFAANEEDFIDPAATNQLANSVKQGLRVVFIKGPENKGLEDAALSLARQAANQKTAIYVLNKQADLANLADKLNAVNKNANNKPDVHFVKYRTPEDAANAQKAIQEQYDSLGGNAQNINGGIAPVINFASQAPVAAASFNAPGHSYLPASVLHRFRL